MWKTALFGVKTSDFSKFMVSPQLRTDKGGREVAPVRTFCEQGWESIFRDFVQTSFIDGP